MIATNIDTTNVTADLLGMAHKCFSGSTPFYLVENSRGELDQDGQLIEYKVTYSKEYGFQCTCKAGKEGFAHCQNYCWHVRAAVACAREEREAMREQEQLNAFQQQDTMVLPVVKAPAQTVVEYSDVDAVTLARVMRRSNERKPTSKPAPLRQGTGFSLLK